MYFEEILIFNFILKQYVEVLDVKKKIIICMVKVGQEWTIYILV